jgi:kojibiose phosphorylase
MNMPDYDTWRIVNTSPAPHTLGQWNSVATISNGYLGLKGNLAEQRDGYSPVTLIHGVYDELDMFSQIRASNEPRRYLDPRYFDSAGKSPAVANLPDPLFMQVFVGEREVTLGRGEVGSFAQVLDLQTGVYRYSFDYRDGAGHTTRIEMERFAALRHAHRVFMRYTITPLDHHAAIRVHSGISGRVRSNTTGERQFRVSELWAWPPERCRLTAHTPARQHDVRLGVLNTLQGGPPSEMAGVAEHDAVYTRYSFHMPTPVVPIVLERCVVLVSTEDLRHGAVADLEAELDAAAAQGFAAALAEQRAAWDALWQRCDVQIDGDDPAQLGLRFCLYHLLAAAPRFSDRLSVPVKLLTGEYYQGNTFYDTDLYIVPFYTFTQPELARTCLSFRYEGLRPGREIARPLGYDGAKFAWQAGPQGEECLGRWWRFTHTNIHINADVAYAVVQYYRATGDERFLAERGIDLLVETARFFASRAVYDAARDRYDLHDVAGPDEGHCESTNNFYTNCLAIRNLRWAADLLGHLATADPPAHAAALRRLAFQSDEPEKWRHVADRLTLLFDPQTLLYEQCAGFYGLKPLPPDLLEDRKVWFATVAPYQALNQPDVVMGLLLLRDEFPLDVRRANWEYYKDKSLNFSSMSFAINALMAADLGLLDEAYKNFIITTGVDLDEALTGRKDTYAGIHGTACGGAWLAAIFGFGGVHLSDQGLSIRPNLPPRWNSLRFNLALRGVVVNVAIDREQVVLQVGHERKIQIPATVAGQSLTLKTGETYTVHYAA